MKTVDYGNIKIKSRNRNSTKVLGKFPTQSSQDSYFINYKIDRDAHKPWDKLAQVILKYQTKKRNIKQLCDKVKNYYKDKEVQDQNQKAEAVQSTSNAI